MTSKLKQKLLLFQTAIKVHFQTCETRTKLYTFSINNFNLWKKCDITKWGQNMRNECNGGEHLEKMSRRVFQFWLTVYIRAVSVMEKVGFQHFYIKLGQSFTHSFKKKPVIDSPK